MQYYSLLGSDPNLECYFYLEHSSIDCHSCYNFEWMAILPAEYLKECRFKVGRWPELLVWPASDREMNYFDPPIKLLGAQCGFGLRNNPPAIEARSIQLPRESDRNNLDSIDTEQCHNSVFDNYEVIWLWGTTPTNRTKYQLNFYPDGQWYKLYGDNPDLGCAEALTDNVVVHGSFFECYQCDMVVDKIRFDSQKGGACRFRLDGWNELVEIVAANDDSLAWNLTTPKRILEVECKVDKSIAASELAMRSAQEGPTSDGRIHECTDPYLNILDVQTSRTNLGSGDDQTEQLAFQVRILVADGNTYFAPVLLDYKFHPAVEMCCLRDGDGSRISCNKIGTAIQVATATQWSPCIFFTEDHRSFDTRYRNPLPDGSKTTPETLINPGDIISGTECGTGA